jgi:hypothetical protein
MTPFQGMQPADFRIANCHDEPVRRGIDGDGKLETEKVDDYARDHELNRDGVLSLAAVVGRQKLSILGLDGWRIRRRPA